MFIAMNIIRGSDAELPAKDAYVVASVIIICINSWKYYCNICGGKTVKRTATISEPYLHIAQYLVFYFCNYCRGSYVKRVYLLPQPS